jgi:hypothetical protein
MHEAIAMGELVGRTHCNIKLRYRYKITARAYGARSSFYDNKKSIGMRTRACNALPPHRRKADNIFARALICALGTFLGPSPSSSRGDSGMLRSEVLFAASRR